VFSFLLAFASIGCAGTNERSLIVNAPVSNQETGIVVTGSGQAHGAPDMAKVTLGVRGRALQAQDAMNEVSRQMAQVSAAIKALGVAEKDLRTEQASLYEERNEVPPPMPMPPVRGKVAEMPAAALPSVHYVAANTIEITVRDLNAVGRIIAAATQAGANEVQNVALTLDDSRALRAAAREKAVADARAQAEQLAALSGAKLGETISIRSMNGGGFAPMVMAKSAMESSMGGDVPFSSGELTVSEQVEIRFAIVAGAGTH
jgi:uncharacterized protein YggE